MNTEITINSRFENPASEKKDYKFVVMTGRVTEGHIRVSYGYSSDERAQSRYYVREMTFDSYADMYEKSMSVGKWVAQQPDYIRPKLLELICRITSLENLR